MEGKVWVVGWGSQQFDYNITSNVSIMGCEHSEGGREEKRKVGKGVRRRRTG